MSDYQHIVDQIRTFLAGTDQTLTPELADLATSYTSLCREANERLRRCVDCLRRGLRSEAIHLADDPPSLLDLVATLDIPELADWENIAITYDLSRPARLLIDAAQELNEAYAAEQPLKTLLAHHRRLALAQAPLSDRLAIMRELAAADPQGEFWEEDIQTFETARLREITSEANAAIRAKDRSSLERLLAEIEPASWRVSIPQNLVQGIRTTLSHIAHEDIVQQVENCMPDLDIAYAAMDLPAAGGIIDTIDAMARRTPYPLPDTLVGRLAPVREWVAAQRAEAARASQFEAACGSLAGGIASGLPTDQLLALKSAALAFGFEMPDELRLGLSRLINGREKTRRARKTRIIVAVSGAIAIVVVATGLLIRAHLNESAAKLTCQQFSDLVVADKLDDALAFWNRVAAERPDLLGRSEMMASKTVLDDRLAAERQRQAEFKAHLAAATAGGAEHPDSRELQQAEWTARTSAEKLAVLDFKAKIASAQTARHSKFAAEVRQKLAQAQALVDQVASPSTDTENSSLTDQLRSTEAELLSLASNAELDAGLKVSLDQQYERVLAARKELLLGVQEELDFNGLLKTLASAKAYHHELAAFVAHYPQSARCRRLKPALADAQAWETADQWFALIKSLGTAMVGHGSDIESQASIKAADAYIALGQDAVGLPVVNAYRDFATRRAAALADDGPWRGELQRLLRLPIISETRMIKLKAGDTYYLPADGKWDVARIGDRPHSVTFQCVLTADVTRPKTITMKFDDLATPEPLPSPQSVLAKELLKQLDALSEDNWEDFPLACLQSIQDAKDVDPVLRVLLVDRIIRSSARAGWGLSGELTKYAESLATLNADDTAWMNPQDTTANLTRGRAKPALSQIPSLAALRSGIAEQKASLAKSLNVDLGEHGILLQDAGVWKLTTAIEPADGSRILAVSRQGDARIMEEIGTIKNGAPNWIDVKMNVLPEGTMVFIVRPPARQ